MQDGYRETDIATHVALINHAQKNLDKAIRLSQPARRDNAARLAFLAVAMFALGSLLGAFLKAAL